MEEILNRWGCSSAISAGGAIALCRLPNSKDAKVFVSNLQPELLRVDAKNLSADTFLFAPYASGNLAYFLKPDSVFSFNPQEWKPISPNALALYANNPNQNISSNDFIEYVNEAIEAIHDGYLQKVVVARCAEKEIPAWFHIVNYFFELCNTYPHAYIYLFTSAQSGTWVGATPELLLFKTENELRSVALAATKSVDDKLPWSDKERAEHLFVERFLRETFAQTTKLPLQQTEVGELVAGNLKHLYSVIGVKTKSALPENVLHKILNAINPTPAVCGTPQTEASFFISEYEQMERRMYAGFSGLCDTQKTLQLYVSLRCMELLNNGKIAVYAGAGITKDSDAEAEWAETNRKMDTLLNLLK